MVVCADLVFHLPDRNRRGLCDDHRRFRLFDLRTGRPGRGIDNLSGRIGFPQPANNSAPTNRAPPSIGTALAWKHRKLGRNGWRMQRRTRFEGPSDWPALSDDVVRFAYIKPMTAMAGETKSSTVPYIDTCITV